MPIHFFLICFLVCLSACHAPDNRAPATLTSQTYVETPLAGTDPLAGAAWHLKNTGQTTFARNAGFSGQDQKIGQLHEQEITGRGIRIAVSDSGVEANHPDLIGNELRGEHRNYSSNDFSSWHNADPYPAGNEAHGTAVTGLISAMGWNGIGSRGVAPDSHFAGFYFLGNFNTTLSSYEARTLDQMAGDFDIFNYSYGYAGCRFRASSPAIHAAYQAGVKNLRRGLGAIYVKAAGNDFMGYNSDCSTSDKSIYLGNTNTNEDQNVPYLILTTAVNAKGLISSYSTPGSGIWVAAAGGEFGSTDPAMITTDITGCRHGLSFANSLISNFNKGASDLNANCNYTHIMNGTSASAPVLSGIVALILQVNPDLSWRDIKHILAMTADKVQYSTAALNHPSGATKSLAGHTYDELYVKNAANISFSNTYGFGRANALAAADMARTYSFPLGKYAETANPNNQNWYYDSGNINLAIPDRSARGVTHVQTIRHNYQIESVQIRLTTDHSYVGDLGVELTSPQGSSSRLLLINSNINQSGLRDFLLITNAFYGETSQGKWTIKLIDGSLEDRGNLTAWKIKINGAPVKPANLPAPLSIQNLQHELTSSSTRQSPVFTITPASAVMRYEVAIGTGPGGQDKEKWYSIADSLSFQALNLQLDRGQDYFINVRAVDSAENYSEVFTSKWSVR